jgi:DNA anti-recombination protein RmuC
MYRMDWTDNRLQERFDSIDRRFDEVDRRFEQVDRRFDKVDYELGRLNSRMDDLQRTIMLIGGGMIATLIAGIFSVVATQL